MKDLMLRIRAEVLKSNIEKVRKTADFRQMMEKRFGEIDDLSKNLQGDLDDHQEALHALAKALRLTDYKNDITRAEQAAANIFNNFLDIRKSVEKLIKNAKREIPVRASQEATEPCKELSNILKELGTEGNRQKAWELYSQHYGNARRLLSEYLEFMSGWALRDAGLDEGMCDLADKLWPAVYNRGYSDDMNYKAVTIPARQETVRVTWARILRMGSPEWTIWALPLITHDTWFAMAQESIDAQTTIEDVDVKAPWIQECLADAYGVWATGPAYAYALFFLRLDPLHVWDGNEQQAGDGERAEAVLQMWKLMGSEDPENDPYRIYLNDLTQEWREAIDAANPKNKPSEIRMQVLSQALQRLFKNLKTKTFGGYSLDDWKWIQDWPDALCNQRQSDINIGSSFAGLHWVLNAAWLARILKPDQFSIIEKQAKLLWDRIAASTEQQKASPTGVGSVASRAISPAARGPQ